MVRLGGFLFVLVGSLFAFTPTPASAASTLYGIDFNNDTLVTIDTTTWKCTPVGKAGSPMFCLGIDFRQGNLYAWDQVAFLVRQLSTTTGGIVNSYNVNSKAFAEGDMAFNYSTGLGYTLSGTGGLTEFDLTTLTSKMLGIPAVGIDGMAWDTVTNQMYALEQGGTQLYTINLANGILTPVGGPNAIPPKLYFLGGLAFEPTTNVLYAALGGAPTDFYMIDKVTGAATKLGSDPAYSLSGIRFTPAPSPSGPGFGPLKSPGEGSFKGVDPSNHPGDEGRFGKSHMLWPGSPLPVLAGPFLDANAKVPASAAVAASPPPGSCLTVLNVSWEAKGPSQPQGPHYLATGLLSSSFLAALAVAVTFGLFQRPRRTPPAPGATGEGPASPSGR